MIWYQFFSYLIWYNEEKETNTHINCMSKSILCGIACLKWIWKVIFSRNFDAVLNSSMILEHWSLFIFNMEINRKVNMNEMKLIWSYLTTRKKITIAMIAMLSSEQRMKLHHYSDRHNLPNLMLILVYFSAPFVNILRKHSILYC